MTSRFHFQSKLRTVIGRYVTLKRALGREFEADSYHLARIDRFLASCDSDLTAETYAVWCSSIRHLTASGRRMRMRIIYNLCIYRRRTEPRCFVPDPTQFPPLPARRRPHIFSEDEIRRVLQAADALVAHPASPLHRHAARLAVTLLYTTGLRRGEAIRLTLGDYDAVERVLTIRETKFHKSRLVPLSADGAREMLHYLQYRNKAGLPREAASPLLLNGHGGLTGYTGAGLAIMLRKLFRRAKVHSASGDVPRVHDLRFTFAVRALARWYRCGADVQAKLPALSTYMGHVSIVSTQYYLLFLDEVAQAASGRFEQHCSRFLWEELPEAVR